MISLNSLFQPSLQFNLRRAAKARIDRMCTPKMRRKDLEAPDYVKTEWKNNGNKNLMADILQRVNWDKDCKLYLVESWNVSWCQNRCFEHCLHWMFTGRMRSATRFSSLSKKRRPSNSPLMRVGTARRISKSWAGTSAILKLYFNYVSIRTYESQAQDHKLEIIVLRKKIDGAKQRCLALGDTHARPQNWCYVAPKYFQSRWDCLVKP